MSSPPLLTPPGVLNPRIGSIAKSFYHVLLPYLELATFMPPWNEVGEASRTHQFQPFMGSTQVTPAKRKSVTLAAKWADVTLG